MTSPERDDLDRLAELARRGAHRSASDAERALSRQLFLTRVDAELRTPRGSFRALRWALPAAALVAAAALFLLLRVPVLTFGVTGAELSGQYVSASERSDAQLQFSDASTIVATVGSRLRVEETTAQGARVLLERGAARVHVVHAKASAWTFAAGPFEVNVTGTRFELAWDPGHETCEVVMQEGSVEVRGPGGSGPISVRRGQRFRGDAKRRTMQVVDSAVSAPTSRELSPSDTAPSAFASASPPPEPAAPASVETVLPRRAPSAEPRGPSWSERVAHGQFEDVLREAEARDVTRCLAACSALDLRALSDAARYAGNGALAERALTSLRQRFPGAAGTEAAFLLGRVLEKRGALAQARSAYESYLHEAPSGSLAAEALAGKLRTVKATGSKLAAQPIAREYLQRFPKGVHVRTAREILDLE